MKTEVKKMTLSNTAQEKLRNYLDLRFSSVSCGTCRNFGMSEDDPNYRCDECYLRRCFWDISKETINEILDKVNEVLEEEDNVQ